MRKINLVFLVVLFLAALSGASTLAAAPAPDPVLAGIFSARSILHPSGIRLASSGVFCDFSAQHRFPMTGTISASGSTCADAQSNLAAQLQSGADNDCRARTDYLSCKFIVETNGVCLSQGSSGPYSAQGYALYNCLNSGN